MVLWLFDGVLWVLFKPPGENVPNNLKSRTEAGLGGYRGRPGSNGRSGMGWVDPGLAGSKTTLESLASHRRPSGCESVKDQRINTGSIGKRAAGAADYQVEQRRAENQTGNCDTPHTDL